MEKINRCFKKVAVGFCAFIICSFLLTGCRGFSHYYWEYDCYWISEQPQICLNKGCGSGTMRIAGIDYEFYTYISNDARYIGFCSNAKEVLWEADTHFKDDCLYLTVTIDNISNYKGQVIKLYKSEDIVFSNV